MSLNHAWSLIWPLLVTGLYVSLAVMLHRSFEPRLQTWVNRLRKPWNSILLNACGWPLLFVLALSGVALFFNLWPGPSPTRDTVLHITRACFLLLFVSLGHQFLNSWFRESKPGSWLRITLLRKVILFTLYTVAAMMILRIFGFPIETPLATLGIGSLAIALAAQQPLSNFFAGVQLSIDRPLEIGQSVTLENGMEGEVLTIGWMKTWLRASDGSRLLIPNAKLTGFIIRNYTLGQRGPAVIIKVPIDRTADLDLAEKLAQNAAQQTTSEISHGDRHMLPIVQYTEMTPTSAVLSVTLYSADYRTASQTRSEFVKKLAAELNKAGIKLA